MSLISVALFFLLFQICNFTKKHNFLLLLFSQLVKIIKENSILTIVFNSSRNNIYNNLTLDSQVCNLQKKSSNITQLPKYKKQNKKDSSLLVKSPTDFI